MVTDASSSMRDAPHIVDLSSHAESERPKRRQGRAAKWLKGTAGKAFFIMMLALLPLAIANIVSNIYSLRTANEEKQELLNSSAQQYAASLTTDIQTIRTAMRLTSGMLITNRADGDICARLQTLYDSVTQPGGINVAIFDRSGKVRCQSTHNAGLLLDTLRKYEPKGSPKGGDIILAPEINGILIRSASSDGSYLALASYHQSALQKLTDIGGNTTTHSAAEQAISLIQGERTLSLTNLPSELQDSPLIRAKAPVAGDKDMVMQLDAVDRLTLNSQLIWLMMPLFLWIAAVFLGWLVMHWLLIKPLTSLSQEVTDYRPGKIIHPPYLSGLASDEIIKLGEQFHVMSHTVSAHESQMHSALERQTRLTREVHHRVKNNLQIISSLISLHWRAATDPMAANAYLAIQRRVDALAVVQRNHYAGLGEDTGLHARPMMNEIASGLKISARVQSGQSIEIAVDCDDVLLHQDVAAPIAFMTAELADIVIASDMDGVFTLSLLRLTDNPTRARFALSAPVFRDITRAPDSPVDLYERVLTGLARQLRTPLGYDAEAGEYHLLIPILG